MFGLFITFVLFKFFKPQIILLISFVLLIVGVLFSTYSNLIIDLPIFSSVYKYFFSIFTAKNGVFFGFPYCAIGLYLAFAVNGFFEKIVDGRKRNLILFISSFVLLCVESLLITRFLNPSETYLWLSVFPMILFFLLFVLSFDVKAKPIYTTARKISIFIYCFEYIPITILNYVFDSAHFNEWYRGLLLFLLVFSITHLLGLGLFYLSKLKWFKCFGYLF